MPIPRLRQAVLLTTKPGWPACILCFLWWCAPTLGADAVAAAVTVAFCAGGVACVDPDVADAEADAAGVDADVAGADGAAAALAAETLEMAIEFAP